MRTVRRRAAAAHAFLIGDAGDRTRFADMHRRFMAAPFFGVTIGGTTVLTSFWAGWWLIALVVAACAIMATAIDLSRRGCAPELVGAGAFVLLEADIALSVLVSGGAESPLLALMIVPVFTQAVCFRPRVTLVFVAFAFVAAVAAVGGAAVLAPSVAVPAAIHLVSFTALLSCLALAAHWLASSDLSARDDAVIDELTGLLNRKALHRRFPELRAQAVALDADLSLVLCDVDRFKAVNDEYGHDRGDRLLVELAERIRQAVRSSDLVYRFGGEEILVLLPGHGRDEALLAGERIRSAVAAWDLAGLRITISAGVSSARGADVDLATLVTAADEALYEAKRSGRDRVCCAASSGRVPAPVRNGGVSARR